ncbi:hypothetical protein GOV12_08290 [Candidatus Pacearchaeota archaeon]|nr:hypothetical protein [Candidatus Pacearchaeota archaeon]
MIEIIIYIGILVVGFIFGLVLAYLCPEEIKKWRKRFFIFSGISLILSVIVFFFNISVKIPVIVSLFFIIITFLTVIWKSY